MVKGSLDHHRDVIVLCIAEKNLNEDEISRGKAANRLRAIADELDGDEGLGIDIENKTIALSPPSSIAYEVGVREKSSVLRGNRETITIKMDWQPE